jgi:peptidoglycan hydrolase-like protein with peptidoglycan-binding domain
MPPLEVVIPPPPFHHHHYWSSGYDSDSTVAAVQRALKRRGYYAGPVDGDAGRETRVAILAFREDHGLASTTRIDRSLLRALGL